jgi:hypothetical protein
LPWEIHFTTSHEDTQSESLIVGLIVDCFGSSRSDAILTYDDFAAAEVNRYHRNYFGKSLRSQC